jgi:hypothetical protein
MILWRAYKPSIGSSLSLLQLIHLQMKTLSIDLTDQQYSQLDRIAAEDKRRLKDLAHLLFGMGLQYFYCDTPISIDKEKEEYTEEERLQEKKNDELETTHSDWNDWSVWTLEKKEELGYKRVSSFLYNHSSDDHEDFIEVLGESIKQLAFDSSPLNQ